MRILVVSNFYPPARSGGYTQWCYEVGEALSQRGHSIQILTSRYENGKSHGPESDIFRTLHLEGDLTYYQPLDFFRSWRKNQIENAYIVERVIQQCHPELVFVWGMWAMSKAVPAHIEGLMEDRVAYYISDFWPAESSMHEKYWTAPSNHWIMRLPKNVLAKLALRELQGFSQPALKFENTICVSEAVKDRLIQAGIPLGNARVIHGGTDLSRFRKQRVRSFEADKLELLYAGQLVDHKGVHTAIEAAAELVNRKSMKNFHLTIVGSGHPVYESSLQAMVSRNGLERYVKFRGQVSRDLMPDLLESYDILVFPSVYEEPLARMTQEAMAAGMVVVGTLTGGTKEILVEGQNGLTFPAGDANVLAAQIIRLISDRDLCRRLSTNGRRTISDNFNLVRMVDEIECYLLSVQN